MRDIKYLCIRKHTEKSLVGFQVQRTMVIATSLFIKIRSGGMVSIVSLNLSHCIE